MKSNKFIILLVIFAFVVSFSLVGCGSSTPAPTPTPDKPAADAPATPDAPAEPADKTYTASDPDNQPKVDMIVPNLTGKVKSGDITQERMDEIIQQVGDGEMSIEELQFIMTGQ